METVMMPFPSEWILVDQFFMPASQHDFHLDLSVTHFVLHQTHLRFRENQRTSEVEGTHLIQSPTERLHFQTTSLDQ